MRYIIGLGFFSLPKPRSALVLRRCVGCHLFSALVAAAADEEVTAGIPHQSRSRAGVVFLLLLPEVEQIFSFFSLSTVSVCYWVRED